MRGHSLTILLVTAVFCLLFAVFNYLADPYLIHRWDKVSDERLSRIDHFNLMRFTKPWHVEHSQPTALVVGSSRTGRIAPDHARWDSERAYNLSMPGMTIRELRRFVEHAHANGPLSKLMIGVDYEALVRPLPPVRTGFVDQRVGVFLGVPLGLWGRVVGLSFRRLRLVLRFDSRVL